VLTLRQSITFAGLVALLVPGTTHAAITSEAQPIVARWIEATGGRAAFLADTALHVKGREVAEGMHGTFEYWSQGPDRILQVEDTGTLRMRAGFDGTAGWRTDLAARGVVPLQDKDLEALRAEAWFLSEQWANDDQGGGSIVFGQTAYRAGHALASLQVTPPVGPPRTLWFDTQTGLLARETEHRDQYTWDESLGGWKTVAGRKRWTVSTIGDSVQFPAGFRRMDVDSLRVEAPGDPAVFSPPVPRPRPVTWLHRAGVAHLPFRYRRGHVWIRVSLNGADPADFILDTGCTCSAVDREYARSIGMELEGQMATAGIGGVGTGGWSHLRSVRIAGPDGDGVVVPGITAGVLALNNDMEKLDWDDTAGLIGYDVLSRFVVEIDFDHQVITLRDPAKFTHTGAGQAVPFTLWDGIPTVSVKLNDGCEGRFIVDVGNATPMAVHSDQVEACHLFGPKRKEVRHWVGGIGGAFPETVCRLDSVRIGPFSWTEPVAGLTIHHMGAAGSKDVQGNLGTSVLDRFKCTFDYARGQLWLEPGSRFALRDRFSRSGIFLVHWSGRVYVAAVVRHSPGEDAGLKVRDVVKSVNGRPAEEWTQEQLEALLDEGAIGSVVKLTVERDLVDQAVELTLADVL